MLDIQNDALASTQASAKGKGKRKAAAVESDDSDDDSDAMHLDAPLSDSNAGDNSDGDDMDLGEDAPPVPMPASGGIQELREKLHARMAQLKQKGRGGVGSGEPGSRDELLEERRQQRAAMRERRRKETKEKIRREEERKGKGKDKGKEKEKQQQKGPQTKVRIHRFPILLVSILTSLSLPKDPIARPRLEQTRPPRPPIQVHLRHLLQPQRLHLLHQASQIQKAESSRL